MPYRVLQFDIYTWNELRSLFRQAPDARNTDVKSVFPVKFCLVCSRDGEQVAYLAREGDALGECYRVAQFCLHRRAHRTEARRVPVFSVTVYRKTCAEVQLKWLKNFRSERFEGVPENGKTVVVCFSTRKIW